MVNEIVLDVHELQPPEPMQKALDALEQLEQGQYLKIIHRMQPFPLYEILLDNGFKYKVTNSDISAYDIYVWRADDQEAKKMIEDLL